MFGRHEPANILPIFKRYQDTYYYMFLAEEIFGNHSSISPKGQSLINLLMKEYGPEDAREQLADIMHEFGVNHGGKIYTDSLTLAEANLYATILGFPLELATRVYPISSETFREKAGTLRRLVEGMGKRHDRNKRAPKWSTSWG